MIGVVSCLWAYGIVSLAEIFNSYQTNNVTLSNSVKLISMDSSLRVTEGSRSSWLQTLGKQLINRSQYACTRVFFRERGRGSNHLLLPRLSIALVGESYTWWKDCKVHAVWTKCDNTQRNHALAITVHNRLKVEDNSSVPTTVPTFHLPTHCQSYSCC